MRFIKDKVKLFNWIFVFAITAIIVSYVLGGVDIIYVQCLFSRKWKALFCFVTVVISALIAKGICHFVLKDNTIFQFDFKKFQDTYNLGRFDCISVFLLTVVGTILRFIGLNWGGGYIQQSDECLLVEPSITMAMEKTLYQRTDFYYPDQFISKFVSLIIRFFAYLNDWEINMQMIEAYYIYRAVTALLGVLIIISAFFIGNYFKKHLGVIFALFVALYPEFILLSKQVTGDITGLFFASLVVLFSLKYMEEKKTIWIFWMTMAIAMATLEKWHGAGLCVYLAVVIIVNLRSVRELFIKGMQSILFYMLCLLILCPNMMFNLKSAIVDGFINIAVYEGGEGRPYYEMLSLYMNYAFNWVSGISYVLLLCLGLVFAIKNKDKRMIILSCGIIKVLILAFMNRGFIRWGLELYFCMLFVAAYGIISLIEEARKRKKIGIVCKSLVIIIAIIFSVNLTLGSTFNMIVASAENQDTRYIQNYVCNEMGISRANSYSEKYTAFWSCIGKEYYDPKFLFIEDGQVYRTDGNVQYFIDFAEEYNEELVSIFELDDKKLTSIDGSYKDVFWRPVSGASRSWNDFEMMKWYISAISNVQSGAYVGPTINIYDVSGYPIYVSDEE